MFAWDTCCNLAALNLENLGCLRLNWRPNDCERNVGLYVTDKGEKIG